MILLNGRGQVGEALKNKLNSITDIYYDVEVYHTWNFTDKSEATQIIELNKYRDFLEKTHKPDNKVVFISTKSDDINYYTAYKHKAEKLTENLKRYSIIRPPILVGKGITQKLLNNLELKENKRIPIGTIDDLITQILHEATEDRNTIVESPHEYISIKLYKELVLYIKNNHEY